MKVETKNSIKVIITVIVLMSIGAFLLSTKGSKAAVTFSVLGIPVLFIAYSYFVIGKEKKLRKDPSVVLKKQEIEKIVFDYKDLLSQVRRAQNDYGINSMDVSSKLDELVHRNFTDVGIIIEDFEGTQTTNYDEELISRTDVGNLETVFGNLNAISKQFKEQTRIHTDSIPNKRILLLSELKNVGYNVDEDISRLQKHIDTHISSNDFIENTSYIDSTDSIFKVGIDNCIQQANKIKHTVEDLNQDVSLVESQISKVSKILESRNYPESVNILKNIMSGLESSASGDFSEIKNGSLSAIQTVLNSVGNYEDENTENLNYLKSQISVIESPSKMTELKELFSKIIPTINKMLVKINEDIKMYEQKISEANPPQEFYQSHSSFQTGLENVFGENEFSIYMDKYSVQIQTMLPIYEQSRQKSIIIFSYNKIKRKIQKKLDADGFVGVKDIRVKNAEEFLKLFAANHPNIVYDNVKNTLEFSSGRPVYSIKIKVIDNDNKNPLENIKVTLKKGTDAIEQVETNYQGELSFEDVLKGDYSLLVDKFEGYETFNKKITVTEDTSLDIRIKKPSFAEKICKGQEESLRKNLKRFSSDLSKEIGNKKFVTSDFNIKIKPDFIPCLLYIWAKENDEFKFIQSSGDKFMVYDENVAKRELDNVLSELETDERESIDDLRDGFFSAPLPKNEIIALIEQLKTESNHYANVKYDDRFIWI